MKHSMLLLVSVLLMAASWTQSPIQIDLNTALSSIYRDEPFLFSVTLTNPAAQSAERWNMAAETRLQELAQLLKEGKIKQQEYDTEKTAIEANKKRSSPITMGSEAHPWTSGITCTATKNGQPIVLPFEKMRNPKSTDIAVLDGKGFYRAWFAILPSEIRKLSPGRYQLKAILDGASATLTLEVKDQAMPTALANSDSMQLRMGKFYWYANDPAKGLEHVERVLSVNAFSINALSLKGDLLLLQQQWQPALDAYTKALEEVKRQFPQSHELPEYLMESIGYARRKEEGRE